jgi:hypothetical protein
VPVAPAVTSVIELAVLDPLAAAPNAVAAIAKVASTVPVGALSIAAAVPVRISTVPPFNCVLTASTDALRPAIASCPMILPYNLFCCIALNYHKSVQIVVAGGLSVHEVGIDIKADSAKLGPFPMIDALVDPVILTDAETKSVKLGPLSVTVTPPEPAPFQLPLTFQAIRLLRPLFLTHQ